MVQEELMQVVHAMGMVANGFLDTTFTPEEIKAYANHYLPDDIWYPGSFGCIRAVPCKT